jgi:hypothetical protein
MGFWDWFLRRKKPPRPADDAEAVRLAVEELGRRHARKQKKGLGRDPFVEADRQVVIDGKRSADISGELLSLTADTFLHQKLYGHDEKKAEDITHAEGGAQAATVASADALAEMRKKGIRPQEHYYRIAERQQTGEIQETFLIDENLEKKPSDATEQDV